MEEEEYTVFMEDGRSKVMICWAAGGWVDGRGKVVMARCGGCCDGDGGCDDGGCGDGGCGGATSRS